MTHPNYENLIDRLRSEAAGILLLAEFEPEHLGHGRAWEAESALWDEAADVIESLTSSLDSPPENQVNGIGGFTATEIAYVIEELTEAGVSSEDILAGALVNELTLQLSESEEDLPIRHEGGETLREGVVDVLRDITYICGRVWEGWQVGTMTEQDFSPAWEDDDLIDSIMDALAQKTPTVEAAKANAWDEGWSRGNSYAINTPTQGADGKWANPYRSDSEAVKLETTTEWGVKYMGRSTVFPILVGEHAAREIAAGDTEVTVMTRTATFTEWVPVSTEGEPR